MKIISRIFLIAICLIPSVTKAQSSKFNDTIIVLNRDTIICKVTQITPSFVFYVKADSPTDTAMLSKRIKKNGESVDNITYCSAYTMDDICSPLIVSKTDEYSGEKTIESPFVDFHNGTYKLSKTQTSIGLWIQFKSSSILTINAGEILFIKFTDGTSMKLVNPKTNISHYSQSGDWNNSFYWVLTQEQVELVKTKYIDSMKIYINEYDFSDNEGEKFKQIVNCLIFTKW